ncbi:MAG: hypothetical protein JKY52_16630 [Flavobacteriales bacterium]|nr:hypothetical protein [Flavobacteriales bacterium]
MRTRLLPQVSLIFTTAILLSACSSVNITSIEKRRYRDGYHVSTKHHKAKKVDLTHQSQKVEQEIEHNTVEASQPISERRKQVRAQVKKIKSSLKAVKKEERSLEAFIVSLDEAIDQAVVPHARKNLARVPTVKADPHDAADPGTGISTVVLVVLLVVLFLILFDPLVAILTALLLALLIIWVLRELGVIEKGPIFNFK